MLTKSELEQENAALKEQVAAQDAREGQVFDILAEMREEIAALKSGAPPTGGGPTTSAVEAAFDAELALLKDEFKDYEAIELVERRVLVGEDVSDDIRLADEPGILEDPAGARRIWKLRKFNFAVEGRAAKAVAEGYVKVKRSELRDTETLPTLSQQDEYVRLGDRGLEVLCKMPLRLYDYKKRRDLARRAGKLSSASAMRDHVANRVAAMAGNAGDSADQAGSFVHNQKTFEVTIEPQAPERVTL